MSEVSASALLESQYPWFKPCFGGEELKRATAALAAGKGHDDKGKNLSPRSSIQSCSLTASLPHNSDPTIPIDNLDCHARELLLASKTHALEDLDVAACSNRAGAEFQTDYETLYSQALVLQELSMKIPAHAPAHLTHLERACNKYEAAVKLCPNSHSSLYNWGVALTDLACAVKDTNPGRAAACLALASQKYADALHLQPTNTQALNNWGLVLKEMSTLAGCAEERNQLVLYALQKFRRAVRLRPDFDRGCYNLGTVYYSYATVLQTEIKAKYKGVDVSGMDSKSYKVRRDQEARIRDIFSAAAQYICLAFALQQQKEIYRKSLSVVHALLPLPFLRAGYLLAPLPSTMGTYKEAWRKDWYVLDHVSLRAASVMESSLSNASSGMIVNPQPRAPNEGPSLVVELSHICSVKRCSDPTLPEGEAVWLGLTYGATEGVYFVAEDALSADTWADALMLCSYIVQSRSSEAMSDALAPAETPLGATEVSDPGLKPDHGITNP